MHSGPDSVGRRPRPRFECTGRGGHGPANVIGGVMSSERVSVVIRAKGRARGTARRARAERPSGARRLDAETNSRPGREVGDGDRRWVIELEVDLRGSNLDPEYWLSNCHGFLVDSEAGKEIGVVDDVELEHGSGRGVALVSIGTDLPEIANSVAAHAQGEGDVNVGDSVGSTLTQYTFVLGLFPFVAAVIPIQRRQVGLVTLLTAAGLGLTILFVADGWLARWEGASLVLAWAVFTFAVVKALPGQAADNPPPV